MPATPRWISDLAGTFLGYLRIGGTSGTRLKNSGANVIVRNGADSADAEITASKVNVSGNDLVLNSDAAGSAADWLYTLRRPSSGMTAALTLTLPVDDGTNGQVLATDGSGALSWVSAASTDACVKIDSTALVFGSGSTVSMLTLPANAQVVLVRVYVDTAFNASGPATASVGISGSASKYMGATSLDLTTVGSYEVVPGVVPSGSTEAIEIAFSAGSGGSAGAARVEVHYAIPA